jgi:peptidoglycan hydrolase-like protein with peptidoglycan-binding domain
MLLITIFGDYMIKINKIFVGLLLLVSLANAKAYFINHDDVCEGTEVYTCTNDFNTIRNLQIALTRDIRLDVTLTEDGKWGENTKKAIIAFQEYYKLKPADGWVGKSTKLQLDKISRHIKFPKDKQIEHISLMTDISAASKSKTFKKTKQIKQVKKGYFIVHDDICEGTQTYTCKNDFNTVRNLQISLSRDKNLHIKLKTDGKWGKSTKKAVIAFQEKYKLTPADGWVGKSTKLQLDKISRHIKFPKDKQQTRVAIIKNNNYTTYNAFKKNVNLRKSFKTFKDKKLLGKANSKNTHLKIDVSEQRIKLLVNGKIALDAPCTTGSKRKLEPNTRTYRDKHTPLGTYRIMEKISAKKSTIFGEMYRNGKKVYHGDRRKYRGPKTKYVGHTMRNWMRLTSGGIGLHASKYVKRYPGSNGCVRIQPKIAKVIFKKVRRGTKVSIVN